MRPEAGDGCKFPAMFECLYKCSWRRRAQGLVYVACIFTHGRDGVHVGRDDGGKQIGLQTLEHTQLDIQPALNH
jgi:hypothetical protein